MWFNPKYGGVEAYYGEVPQDLCPPASSGEPAQHQGMDREASKDSVLGGTKYDPCSLQCK